MYERIICLTEETCETLYLLGEEERIVGISNFTVRPARAREEKPRISTFLEARTEKILDLRPDLVIGFSDIQADIAADLIRAGVEVYVLNHRSVKGILLMIDRLAAMVGVAEKGRELSTSLESRLEEIRARTGQFKHRPSVYFEEWYDPLISGIGWVSELVQIAGGDDCFAELGTESLARGRIIPDPMTVVERRPDIMFASWCGKKFKRNKVLERPGWDTIPAVRNDQIFDIDSSIILQPGPAALTDGVDLLHARIQDWCDSRA